MVLKFSGFDYFYLIFRKEKHVFVVVMVAKMLLFYYFLTIFLGSKYTSNIFSVVMQTTQTKENISNIVCLLVT